MSDFLSKAERESQEGSNLERAIAEWRAAGLLVRTAEESIKALAADSSDEAREEAFRAHREASKRLSAASYAMEIASRPVAKGRAGRRSFG